MATEATSENIVKAPKLTNDELMNTTENLSKSDNDIPKKNDLKAEKLKQSKLSSTAASINGGSDSEASKAEISKSEGEEKSHFRTTSTVKKLTSFKPVSVNKKFLAAKSIAAVAPSKLGDGGVPGSTSAQVVPLVGGNTARPRLVAKSGPSLHSTPRTTTASSGGRVSGAPDASAVWNKNRPVPPPEPKRFTDEELKQRYGIHLATRLQSDDAGKQANWADIDDDDDDWAPNTMEWADGTKITLPKAEDTAVPVQAQAPIPAAEVTEKEKPITSKVKAVETIKPRSPAPAQKSESPPVRTVGFSGRTGLVLKGATEKPTLVAKPPGPPTPVKSPWAPLPPVEKVAPTATEAPQLPQPQQNRLSQKDTQGSQGAPLQGAPLQAAKEIAADDFSRSWRDASGSSKELYNAQSGRYEPANDNRKAPARSDPKNHQPAVLQRSHQEGPAEPSPAFQTHRAGGQDNPSRRRNSSNVSGVSENVFKRVSRGELPHHEIPSARKGSLTSMRDDLNPSSNLSSSTQSQNQRCHQSQIWQSRPSAVAGQSSPQAKRSQIVPAANPPIDNQNQSKTDIMAELLEFQKKEMQLKRELAIARRREEADREEAERRERIRIKLESMGPSPEKKKKDLPKTESLATTEAKTREETVAVSVDPKPKLVDATVNTNTKVSDSKPKTPDSNLKPSDSKEQKASDSKEHTVSESKEQKNNGSKNQKIHISSSTEPSTVRKYLPPDARPNGNLFADGISSQNQSSNEIRPSQSWQSSSSDNFKPWASAPQKQSSSLNVWGPPTNDRTLGNGTFNPELSRVPEISTHPGPIGPLNSNRGKPQTNDREYGPRPAPIGPPNRRRQSQSTSEDSAIRPAVANSGWATLPHKIAEEDARRAQQQQIEISRARELREKGLLKDPPPPVVQDTWRQVSINEDGSRGQIHASHTTFHNEGQLWKEPKVPTNARRIFEEQDDLQRRHLDTIGGPPQFSDAWRSTSNMNLPPTRGSRFFPNSRDVRLEEYVATFDRPESPSPPPPTQQGHPAYDGNVARPHVSLPRPVPVVKLPPPKVLAPIGPPKPISFAAIVATPAVPAKARSIPRPALSVPQSQTSRREDPVAGNWQEKFNTLIGRKTTSVKKSSLPVDSSSKNALEVPKQQSLATVFLPSFNSGDSTTESSSIESKPVAEECFEEQEMGSLPPVKLPSRPPTAAWNPAPNPKPLPRKFLVSQTASVESISFPQHMVNNNPAIKIKFPGQLEVKIVSLFITGQKSNSRRGVNRLNSGLRHSTSHQRARGKDFSISPQPRSSDHAVTTSSSSSSSRGRVRGFGNNWKRQSATPVQT